MLQNVFERYFRRKRPATKPDPPRLAYQIDGTLPPGPLSTQLMACVLRQGELIAVSRDAAPRVQDGEVFWLLPADDLTVPVVLDLDDSPLAIDLTVRFETDPTIAVLLRDRQALTREEIGALLASELEGLLDLLGQSPGALTTLDDEDRERLGAKRSLMLQAKGLRCTGLGEFRKATVVAEPEEPAVEAVDAAAGVGQEWTEPETERAELEPVLAEVIGQVRSADQWEELVEQIEASGMPLEDSAAEEMDSLGQLVVQRQIDATQAARHVSELAEAARRDAGVVQPDLRHWQGLALRMRLMDAAEVERNSFRSEPEEVASERNEFRSTRSHRPWTWSMLRRTSVDQRLRQFLHDVVCRTRGSMDAYRNGLQQISTAGSVKELSDRFRVVEDLLETFPTLVPVQRQYRLDRQQQKQAVQNIQRPVTAAEPAQAAVHGLSTQPEGAVPWQTALVEADVRLTVQMSDVALFLQNLLGAQAEFSVSDLRGALLPIVRQAMWESVGRMSITELTGPQIRRDLDAAVEQALGVALKRYGIGFGQVQTVSVKHEKYDEHRQKVGETWLLREGLEQQRALDELYSADELRKIQRQERTNELELLAKNLKLDRKEGKLAAMLRRVGIRSQIRDAVLSDKFDKIETAEQLTQMLQQVDRDRLIRQDERDELKAAYKAKSYDREAARKHSERKLEQELGFELSRLWADLDHQTRLQAHEHQVELASRVDNENNRRWLALLERQRGEAEHRRQEDWKEREHQRRVTQQETGDRRDDQWQEWLHEQRIDRAQGELAVTRAERNIRLDELERQVRQARDEDALKMQQRQQLNLDRQRSETELVLLREANKAS